MCPPPGATKRLGLRGSTLSPSASWSKLCDNAALLGQSPEPRAASPGPRQQVKTNAAGASENGPSNGIHMRFQQRKTSRGNGMLSSSSSTSSDSAAMAFPRGGSRLGSRPGSLTSIPDCMPLSKLAAGYNSTESCLQLLPDADYECSDEDYDSNAATLVSDDEASDSGFVGSWGSFTSKARSSMVGMMPWSCTSSYDTEFMNDGVPEGKVTFAASTAAHAVMASMQLATGVMDVTNNSLAPAVEALTDVTHQITMWRAHAPAAVETKIAASFAGAGFERAPSLTAAVEAELQQAMSSTAVDVTQLVSSPSSAAQQAQSPTAAVAHAHKTLPTRAQNCMQQMAEAMTTTNSLDEEAEGLRRKDGGWCEEDWGMEPSRSGPLPSGPLDANNTRAEYVDATTERIFSKRRAILKNVTRRWGRMLVSWKTAHEQRFAAFAPAAAAATAK